MPTTLKQRVRDAVERGLAEAFSEQRPRDVTEVRALELVGEHVAPLLKQLEDEHARELNTYRSSDADLRRDLAFAEETRLNLVATIERYQTEADQVTDELRDREQDLATMLALAGAETLEEFRDRLTLADRLSAAVSRLEELAHGIDSGQPRPAFRGSAGPEQRL